MANSAESSTMFAFQYYSHGGGSDALKYVENLLKPVPGKGELLVKVEAASLNPTDWKIQQNMWRDILHPFHRPKFPFIPVTDISGVVSAVGLGVDTFKEGDQVVSKLPLTTSGGLAEYAVAPANMTVIRPSELSAAEGSGLVTAALTALQAVKSLGVRFDGNDDARNILITAASGGVGHYAVQLAKLGKFHITATCGSANLELVKGLGADEVVDYNTPDGESLKSPSGRKYDSVINCAAGTSWSNIKLNLTASAKVIDIAPKTSNSLRSIRKKITSSKQQLVILELEPYLENLKLLVNLANKKKIKTVVDSMFPFNEAKDAWAKNMSGDATGKIIIEMPVIK